ncbi:MAG TPA: PIG-L family deacetylase [Candidatus Saccharimonadia bacterium]|nr:PIG-L family deacetylase [Candidatus Saccharimonadia bacterium]
MAARIQTTEDIRQLGTILGVWAHPDDESFLAAGLLAAAVRNGQTVVCVTATKGEAGVQDAAKWPPETLGETRAAEMQATLEILGIRHHQWLDYPDGGCAAAATEQAVAKLAPVLARYRPDTIITFGPDGLTGHHDHCTVSRWATLAAAQQQPPPRIFHAVHTPEQYEQHLKAADAKLNMYFNIDQPPLVPLEACAIAYDLPRDILSLKHRALLAMPSQYEQLHKVLLPRQFYAAFAAEYFVEATPARVVASSH